MEPHEQHPFFVYSEGLDRMIKSWFPWCCYDCRKILHLFEPIIILLNIIFMFITFSYFLKRHQYELYQNPDDPDIYYTVSSRVMEEYKYHHIKIDVTECPASSYFKADQAVSFVNSLDYMFFIGLCLVFCFFFIILAIRRGYLIYLGRNVSLSSVKSSQEIQMVYYLIAATLKPTMSTDYKSDCLIYRGHIIPFEMFSYVMTWILGLSVIILCIQRRFKGYHFSPFTVLFSLFPGIGEHMQPNTQANRYGGPIIRVALYLFISFITLYPLIQFLNSNNASTICIYTIGLSITLLSHLADIENYYYKTSIPLAAIDKVVPDNEQGQSATGRATGKKNFTQTSNDAKIFIIGQIFGYKKIELVKFKTLTGRIATLNYNESFGGVFIALDPIAALEQIVVRN